MKKDRLLKLAALLEADAANKTGIKFDLSTWGEGELTDSGRAPVTVSCGTTACAIGLAVLSGVFKRAGLRNCSCTDTKIVPEMPSGRDGFYAVAELFGISTGKACWLFMDTNYPPTKRKGAAGERYVAKRIRGLVDGTAKLPKNVEDLFIL